MREYILSEFSKYKISEEKIDYFFSVVSPIFMHPEFQKRVDSKFLHHGKTSLGMHIINNSILTYILCFKFISLGYDIDIDLALKISMLHDLYEVCYKDKESCVKKSKVINLHGFVHPIEAVINSFCWYTDIFKDEDEYYKIIDGIIHHMWPFPVRCVNDFLDTEINNYGKLVFISDKVKSFIVESSNRFKIFNVSFGKCICSEGNIVSLADKIVSLKEIFNFKNP